jgi:hypothetical protein
MTENRVETVRIDPGKPWQNCTNESFNGRLRDECLNVEWFRTKREARVLIEAWRNHYNAIRLHMSRNYMTTVEFRQQHQNAPINPKRAVFQESAVLESQGMSSRRWGRCIRDRHFPLRLPSEGRRRNQSAAWPRGRYAIRGADAE